MTARRIRAFLTAKQIANRYDVGVATIWRWAREGTMPKPIKIGPNCTRWKLDEIEKWEAEREMA